MALRFAPPGGKYTLHFSLAFSGSLRKILSLRVGTFCTMSSSVLQGRHAHWTNDLGAGEAQTLSAWCPTPCACQDSSGAGTPQRQQKEH